MLILKTAQTYEKKTNGKRLKTKVFFKIKYDVSKIILEFVKEIAKKQLDLKKTHQLHLVHFIGVIDASLLGDYTLKYSVFNQYA